MKNKIFLLILFAATSSLFGQKLEPTVVSSGGGYFSAGGYTLSATIGEIAVTTLKTASLILTQGFQQPEDDFGTRIKETGLDWSISAYPNPVSEFLNIRFDLTDPIDLNVEILDMSGRKHLIRELYYVTPGEIVTFDMSGFVRGVYMVRIYTPDQRVQKVYKIQKF